MARVIIRLYAIIDVDLPEGGEIEKQQAVQDTLFETLATTKPSDILAIEEWDRYGDYDLYPDEYADVDFGEED